MKAIKYYSIFSPTKKKTIAYEETVGILVVGTRAGLEDFLELNIPSCPFPAKPPHFFE